MSSFDRFGRVKQQLWRSYTGAGSDLDRFSYEHDRNGNRLYRKNEVTAGAAFSDTIADEGTSRRQTFTIDSVGNWTNFKNDAGTAALGGIGGRLGN